MGAVHAAAPVATVVAAPLIRTVECGNHGSLPERNPLVAQVWAILVDRVSEVAKNGVASGVEHVPAAALVRWSASALIVAGVVLAVTGPLHPSLRGVDISTAVRGAGYWGALHLAGLAFVACEAYGLAGIVAVHHRRLPRYGVAGALLMVPGLFSLAGIAVSEAVAWPVLATDAPQLLTLNSPLLRSAVFVVSIAPVVLVPVGVALVGAAIARSRVLPAAAGWAFAATTVAFFALDGPFVPVLGPMSAVAAGAAHIWLGVALWRRAGAPREAVGRPGGPLIGLAGCALATAGVLLAVGAVLHPDILETDVAAAVRATPRWDWLHIGYLLALVLQGYALAGMVALHAGRLGRIGITGAVLAVPGLAAAAGGIVMEATTFPIAAAAAPNLLAWSGPILSGPSARVLAVAAVPYFLGFILVAIGVARAGVLPAAPGWLFAVSLVLYAALAGPFVQILGWLSGLLLAAAALWLGTAIWRVALDTRHAAPTATATG